METAQSGGSLAKIVLFTAENGFNNYHVIITIYAL